MKPPRSSKLSASTWRILGSLEQIVRIAVSRRVGQSRALAHLHAIVVVVVGHLLEALLLLKRVTGDAFVNFVCTYE